MGCRSFLTPDRFSDKIGNVANALNYKEGEHKYYGRFNQGVVTLNLVDVACSSGKDMDKFWKILEERLELCHKALRCRHERLLGTPSDVAPILWQYGAIARLKKGETIDKLLYNGYSTISLGYAGLYEMCYYMTGKSHTDEEAKDFALAVMQAMNDACNRWKAEENIDYSVYGTPLESTTYKFAKKLQDRFGIIENVTSHNYITNSYHVNVREKIDAFSKLSFESDFQKLSPGGAISYVEVPDLKNNIPAVLSVIQYIYENIIKVIHIVDTDGVFTKDCVMEADIEGIQYFEDHMECANVEAIERRNKHKSEILFKLYSTGKVHNNIVYRLYYNSCNLEHVLYGELKAFSDDEKEEMSDEFAEKYEGKVEDFIAFISDETIAVHGTYKETWRFIEKGKHSLERHSNMHLIFTK